MVDGERLFGNGLGSKQRRASRDRSGRACVQVSLNEARVVTFHSIFLRSSLLFQSSTTSFQLP